MRQFYITAGGCLTTCTPLHSVLCSFAHIQNIDLSQTMSLKIYLFLNCLSTPTSHMFILQFHIIFMKLCFDNILKIILYSRNSGQASILLKYSWMAKSINSLIKELFLVSSLLQVERNMEENSFRDHLRITLAK